MPMFYEDSSAYFTIFQVHFRIQTAVVPIRRLVSIRVQIRNRFSRFNAGYYFLKKEDSERGGGTTKNLLRSGDTLKSVGKAKSINFYSSGIPPWLKRKLQITILVPLQFLLRLGHRGSRQQFQGFAANRHVSVNSRRLIHNNVT